MSIVTVGKKNLVCATCEFWDGPRNVDDHCSTFDSKASGTCTGEGFSNWKVGAVSSCLKWRLWQELEDSDS